MHFEEQLHKLIAKRALELSQLRKNGGDNETSDWVRAEQEILHELDLHSDELLEELDISSDYR